MAQIEGHAYVGAELLDLVGAPALRADSDGMIRTQLGKHGPQANEEQHGRFL
jgi:hypothetical protein